MGCKFKIEGITSFDKISIAFCAGKVPTGHTTKVRDDQILKYDSFLDCQLLEECLRESSRGQGLGLHAAARKKVAQLHTKEMDPDVDGQDSRASYILIKKILATTTVVTLRRYHDRKCPSTLSLPAPSLHLYSQFHRL